MLNNVTVSELVQHHIQTVSAPFATKHHLKLDEILADYAREVMLNTRHSNGVSYEDKILKVIQLILDNSLKADIVMELMRRSSIPWSLELQHEIDIAPSYFPSNMKEDFGLQLKLMNVKLMLQRYDINNFNVADTKLATKLVPFILKRVDMKSAVEDAQQVYSLLTLVY